MNTLVLLYKLKWRMFINKYFKDKRQSIKSILLLSLILGAAALAIYFLNTRLMGNYDDIQDENAFLTINIVLSIMFMLVFSFQFFASLLGLIPNFYQSPDMNYLVSTPLKSGIILIYKLFNHIFSTIMKEAIIFIPILIATAISLNVRPIFYLLLPIIYFLVATVSAGIGITLGMFYLQRFSIKSYRYLVNGGNFILTSFVWIFFVFNVSIPNPIINFSEWLFTTEYFYLIIPFLSGAKVLASFGVGSYENLAVPLLFLVLTSGCITFLTYRVAQKSFYTGWMNSTHVEKIKVKKRVNSSKKLPHSNLPPMLSMIKYEWIRASKNYDIIAGSLMFYLAYGLLIYFSIKFGSHMPELISCLVVGGGIFFVYTATSVPFFSSEITKNPLTVKYQHSLLKYLPISAKEVLLSRIIMVTLPSVLILTIGISIFSFIVNLSLYTWLLVVIAQFFITIGYGFLNQSFENIYYQAFFDQNKLLGSILSFLIVPIYLILTIGLYLIYLVELPFLAGFTSLLNIPVIVIIATTTILFQLTYMFKLGQKSWDKMEF